MITIEVTPSDLSEIVRVLNIKVRGDRERAGLLITGLVGIPHDATHPNWELARSFFKQARELNALAKRLEDQV